MSDNGITARRQERRRMMLEDPVIKVIPYLAVPMIISMLIDSFYNIADTYFVSQLGMAATGAVGVNDSLTHFMRAIALGLGMGSSSYISRLLGAKKDEDACRVASTTLFTAIAFLSCFAAVVFVFVDPVVTLLGATENAKPYAMDYARFILLSAPFTAGEVVLSQTLRSEGSSRYSMFGMVSGCLVNVALDPIFIHGLGLGVAGAAIATTISKAVSFLVLLLPFLRNKCLLEIKPSLFTPRWSIYREVLKMGIPVFLRSSLMSVSTVVVNTYAGQFSDAALAASSVASKCTRVVGSAIMGFGQGFQPLAGYCWGAKRFDRVRRGFFCCCGIGAAAAILLGGSMAACSRWLVSIFVDEPEVIRVGGTMIRTQCYVLTLHVWVMVTNGLFQALGRPISAAVLGISRQALCLIPAVIVLSELFGVEGLSVAQATADILSFLIALPLFLRVDKELRQKQQEQVQAGPEANVSFIEGELT